MSGAFTVSFWSSKKFSRTGAHPTKALVGCQAVKTGFPSVRSFIPSIQESPLHRRNSDWLTDPLFPGPNGLRARPHAVLPLHAVIVHTGDHGGRVSGLLSLITIN